MIYGVDISGNKNYDKYLAVFSHGQGGKGKLGTFECLIDDDSLSWSFGTELSDNNMASDALGAVAGAASNINSKYVRAAGKLAERAGQIGGALDSIHQAVTGASIGESLLANTIQRPTSKYGNLPISVTGTFYKGMKLKNHTCGSFSEFQRKLAKIHLPSLNGTYLRTPQIDTTQYGKIFLGQTVGLLSKSAVDLIKKELWSVRLGNFFHLQGYWMTDAKVDAINAYDDKGHPLIWTCSFSFSYFRQLTQDDVNSMFLG